MNSICMSRSLSEDDQWEPPARLPPDASMLDDFAWICFPGFLDRLIVLHHERLYFQELTSRQTSIVRQRHGRLNLKLGFTVRARDVYVCTGFFAREEVETVSARERTFASPRRSTRDRRNAPAGASSTKRVMGAPGHVARQAVRRRRGLSRRSSHGCARYGVWRCAQRFQAQWRFLCSTGLGRRAREPRTRVR